MVFRVGEGFALPVYQTKLFARFARHEAISDASLVDAVARADRGLIDADLGGGVIKLRIARAGGGRSGGYRVLVAFRIRDLAVFLFGFAKSERQNIDNDELRALRLVAQTWLAADTGAIRRALDEKLLIEVRDGE